MARAVVSRRATFLCATATVFASAAGAQAQAPAPPTTVAVYAPPCIGRPFDRATLGEMLRVELRTLGVSNVFVDSPDAPSNPLKEAPLAIVVVSPATCEPGAQEVTIKVVDRTIPKSVERRMAISDIDLSERPRALAIAIAELLAASFAELELAGAPRGLGVPPEVHAAIVSRLVPVADAAGRAAVRQVDSQFEARDRAERGAERLREVRDRAPSLDLAALARAFPARGTALVGGTAAARFRPARGAAFHVGVEAGGGDTDVLAGSVTVGAIAGRVGAGVTTEGPAELEVGPALSVGYGWAKGSSHDASVRGSSYDNAFVVALATATLRVRTSSSWSALLGADLGYALTSIAFLSDAGRVAGLGGVALGLRAGVGIAF